MKGETKLYTDQEWMILLLMSSAVDDILDFIKNDHRFFIRDERLTVGINPNTCRTGKGFMLIVQKATQTPTKICSPLGEWQCFGGCLGQWHQIINKILDLFQAEEDFIDENYRYYKIHRITKTIVKDIGINSNDSVGITEQKKKMEQMMKRYRSSQKRKK